MPAFFLPWSIRFRSGDECGKSITTRSPFFLSDCYTDEKRVLDHYLAAKQIPFHTTLTQIVWRFL